MNGVVAQRSVPAEEGVPIPGLPAQSVAGA